MFKQTVIGITCFLLGLAGGMGLISHAGDYQDFRIEVLGGTCQHRLAQDASWSYREWGDYQTNMQLNPDCLQAGFSWMPKWKELGGHRMGLRFAYVNLGKIVAHNTFPADEPEYMNAKAEGRPINSPTSAFEGHGGSKGITYGLASEFNVKGVHVGPEAGIATLYSKWRAYFWNNEEEVFGCGVGWACADGWHSTLYAGMTVRYEWLMFSTRRYFNVHASQAEKNPLFIGPTTGPVDTFLVGLSIPLK